MKLKDKVAVVTGGARGIGRGICLALIKEGAKVVFVDRLESEGRETERELKALGDAMFLQIDLANRSLLSSIIDQAITTHQRLDILVNAAQASRQLPFEETDVSVMNLAFDTGFWPTFLLMQAAFPHLKASRGKVINFGSGAAFDGQKLQSSYVAAKEAIRGITRVAANEWGPFGITVNVVCPAANSPGVEEWRKNFPHQFEAGLRAIPLGRVGDCEKDVGRVVAFLASEDADFITGQTICVDGGSFKMR